MRAAWLLLLACTGQPGALELSESSQGPELEGLGAGARGVRGEVQAHLGLVVARFTSELASPVAGRVVAQPRGLGDRVAAGEPVVQLDEASVRHALRAAEAQAQAAASKLAEARETERYRTGRAERTEEVAAYVSADEVREEQYQMRRAAALASSSLGELEAYRAEAARLRDLLEGLSLRAPFDGEVAVVYHGPGDAVLADEPVVRLVSEERLVRFAIDAGEAEAASVGGEVEIEAEGQRVVARVIARAPEVDEAGMVLAEAAALEGSVLPWRAGTPCSVRPQDRSQQ